MSQSYHHGALREALLDEGRLLLGQRGPEAVSLRELARRVGVSHSAPERHFANRGALLEALAIRGYAMLSAVIRQALAESGSRLEDRFRAAATAYVDFATENGRLLELMFTSKSGKSHADLTTAVEDLFALTAELVGESEAGAASSLRILLAATLQGIAGLAATRRVSADGITNAIDDAVAVFVPAIRRRYPPSAAT